MTRVSISAGSALAAETGAGVADAGGNAVDAAVAATVTAMTTEPGIIAPGAGTFVTVWAPGSDPVVIDGYAVMPGIGHANPDSGDFGKRIFMEYGGGMHTLVGAGSVTVPGVWAALGSAIERFGARSWADAMAPATAIAQEGFRFSAVSAAYLSYAHEPIFDADPESWRALHHDDGTRVSEGEVVRIAGLADSLQAIADDGPATWYTGDLARRMVDAVAAGGGRLTSADLEQYRALDREPITVELDGWTVATNPAPAVGGAVMAALLLLIVDAGFSAWSDDHTRVMAEVQRAVLRHRTRHLDGADDAAAAVETLLGEARKGDYRRLLGSPSTVHVSAVDSNGLACAITTSAGYGSGTMIPGTGLWLNNCLGEIELHPDAGLATQPGERLASNMAPTVARHESGAVLAIGSPGASRITTAIAQVLVNHIRLGMSITDAVAHPRLHVEVFEGDPTIAHEPGIPVEAFADLVVRRFPDLSMYFGGVGLALWDPHAGLFEAADPRRSGAVATGGT